MTPDQVKLMRAAARTIVANHEAGRGVDPHSLAWAQSLLRQPGSGIEIVAYGLPAPQGSKSFKGMVNGRAVMAESSKKVKPWRQDVKAAAEVWRAENRMPAPLDGPLVVSMVFTMPKPASAPKRRRTWPDRMPDLSKLLRSTEDALTDAGLWVDDARVVEYGRLAKVYPGEDPEALSSPGVRIRVRPLVESAEPAHLETLEVMP
jgi:Holliday junction resolvase RusA-like endonuclease